MDKPDSDLAEVTAAPKVDGRAARAPEREDESNAPCDGTLFDQVRRLQPSAKFRLALQADQATRAVLLQDVDRRILLALCKNPHITVDEVLRIARNTQVLSNTLEYIIKDPQWMGREEIRYAVAVNPETPVPTALQLLRRLSRHNLRTIAKSSAVRLRIKNAALKLVVESPE